MNDDVVAAVFDKQAGWCDSLGSAFTAGLMRHLAQLARDEGPLCALIGSWPGDPMRDALPLRVAGALHALVLARRDPVLAAHYPPHAAAFDPAALGPAIELALRRDREHFARWLEGPPQTNEVARSAVLLGGFALIARRTRLPLALYEIGASAGLNLCWDRFGYALGAQHFGPAESPLRLACEWRGAAPALPDRIDVIEPRGCDVAPLDVRVPAEALRLAAYVWPDQRERLARLEAAIAIALQAGVRVEAADAADWIERRLALREGAASVVYHTIVWQYLSHTTRSRMRAHLEALGAQASAATPLAWLRLEFVAESEPPRLVLTSWPGGAEEMLARAHPHGAWVEWLDR